MRTSSTQIVRMGSSPEIAFKSLSLERKDVVSEEGAGGVGVQEGGKIGLGRASERAMRAGRRRI